MDNGQLTIKNAAGLRKMTDRKSLRTVPAASKGLPSYLPSPSPEISKPPHGL